MKELIEALNIFLKYTDMSHPFHCEHDILTVDYDKNVLCMTKEDVDRLDELGFFWNDNEGHFNSWKYGSC